MEHTELTKELINIASQIQQEKEAEYCAPIFYYLAIRKIIDNPSLLEGKDIDKEEVEKLKNYIDEKKLPSLKQVEEAINNDNYNHDKSEASDLKRWFSLGRRTAIDVIKMIADGCIVENSNTSSDEDADKTESDNDTLVLDRDGFEKDITSDPKEIDQEDINKAGRPISDVVYTAGKLKSEIKKHIFGQDNAVNKFVNTFFKGEFLSETDNKKRGPRCLFTFLGMPGVGKTYLAQIVSETIGRPGLKVDLSNGQLEIMGERPDRYKNKEPKRYQDFVEAYPKCIILFDEVEKAPTEVILSFLSMIDGGTSGGVDFRDAIVIFTTNAGKSLYSLTEYGRLSNIPDAVIKEALSKEKSPLTNRPVFQPEFVSRLAAGTLIMFDRLTASDLINMTTNEFERHIKNTDDRFGIKINTDKFTIATALFSLGGNIDGRNAVNKGKRFYTEDIYELLMLASEERGYEITDSLEEVSISVNTNDAPDEIKKFYSNDEELEFVFFAEDYVRELIEKKQYSCTVKCPKTIEEYYDILANDNVTASFIDYKVGSSSADDTLNVEDIKSDGRDAFDITVKKYKETTTYIFSFEHSIHNNAEKTSFISSGAQDVVVLPEDVESFINEKCRELSLNYALETLGLRHKVLSYNMAQRLSSDGKKATIELYNLNLEDAVEAEDRKAIMTDDEMPNLTWDDIVVSDKVEEDLNYYISYLKDPKGFLAKAKKAPKGVLFYGPPGTGKTSIAKVVASISGVRFIATAGANFQSKWAGDTTENVIKMFATARRNAPCVLFIDEIDAIAGKRKDVSEDTGGAVKDQNSVVTALLNEMDGFKTSPKKPVFVIAATNTKEGLDEAILRRFDKDILLDNPDKEGRIKVLKLLRKKNSDIVKITDEFIDNLATRSIGSSPAELEKAISAAIGIAIRRGTDVTDELLDETFEESIYGEEKKWSDDELLRTARHEVGHAFISHYYGETPDYLTIVARGNHGGYSMTVGDEKKGLRTKPELLHKICLSLGGRAAEVVYYGDEEGVSTGPSGDLNNATSMARNMICRYGMSEKLGLIATEALGTSDTLNTMILEEISEILNEQFELAKKIITDNKEQFDKFVEALMENHSMTGDDIKKVLS
ncbi:MAG: AAA family ATPase [Lachnospiraceae bacterium]|nr:AAA family ATPase [Lachnospiraceae bacterium]